MQRAVFAANAESCLCSECRELSLQRMQRVVFAANAESNYFADAEVRSQVTSVLMYSDTSGGL